MAIWNSDGSLANVQALHNQAATHDGDTITLPNGNSTWNGTLRITKRIILIGNTTTNPVLGTAVSNTIITCATANGDIISIDANGGQRISGIAFEPVSVNSPQTYGGIIRLEHGTDPVRIDHCYFHNINAIPNIGWYDYSYGVIDHCVQNFPLPWTGPHGAIVYCHMGAATDKGDLHFSQPANFGGSNFLFVEDNWIIEGPDITVGGKVCGRYNHMEGISSVNNGLFVSHGTARTYPSGHGGRCYEIYNNNFHWNNDYRSIDGPDSGSACWHDNTMENNHLHLGGMVSQVYRAAYSFGASFFGAHGANPYDYNATEADGTHIDGHAPFVFASGTLTAGTGGGTLVDNTKNWALNQWAGYSVRRPNDEMVGSIVSNTANTLTLYLIYDPNFAAGQTYQICKVLKVMDQPGLGAGDLMITFQTTLAGTITFPSATVPLASTAGFPTQGSIWVNGQTDHFVFYTGISGNTLTGCTGGFGTFGPGTSVNCRKNTVTGKQDWPHQVLEPMYSWNNINTDDNTHLNYELSTNAQYTIVQGVHFFNDTVMPGYTPYTYPHPLVGGASRIIALRGPGGALSLDFGNVLIGSISPTMILTVQNTGTALLTVSAVSYPAGFSGATGGFIVAAGSSFDIVVTFTPLLAQLYSGNITVTSDATSGGNTIPVTGTGVNPIPPPGVHGHRKQARDAFGY